MHILCEEKILFAHEAFSGWGEVATLPPAAITPETVQNVDILIVRSATKLNAALLDGSRIQFAASATAGTDHIDHAYLASRGIPFTNAPGCNAESVVEYVLAALIELAHERQTDLRGKTIGIVGVGEIGSRLALRAQALGLQVLLSDPPLEAAGGSGYAFTPFDVILVEADILTLHVPLVKRGPHPTYHLIDTSALQAMKDSAWLINACRGAVVDNQALKTHLQEGGLGSCVLDVWEGEPVVDLALMELVDIASPHIAGYSYDGKLNGTIQVYQAVEAFLGEKGGWDLEAAFAPAAGDRLHLKPSSSQDEPNALLDLTRQMYNIYEDDLAFRKALSVPADHQAAFFRQLRRAYPRRRSFSAHRLPDTASLPFSAPVVDGLRVGKEAGA